MRRWFRLKLVMNSPIDGVDEQPAADEECNGDERVFHRIHSHSNSQATVTVRIGIPAPIFTLFHD